MSAPKIQLYLIHNEDKTRFEKMFGQYEKYGVDTNNVRLMVRPRISDLSDDFIRKNLVIQTPSISNEQSMSPEYLMSRRGLIVCTYKHYLCYKDFLENTTEDVEYALIMEDNATYTKNVFELLPVYIKQLNEIYGEENWDVLFDTYNPYWGRYTEMQTQPDIYVYPKSNEISRSGGGAGSTKTARFYLIRRGFAKKLYENYLPFNNGPDLWMNDLFRKLGARSFWVEPSLVHVEENHRSSTECLC